MWAEEEGYIRSQCMMKRENFTLAVVLRAGRTSRKWPWLKREQEGEVASKGPFQLHQQAFHLETTWKPWEASGQ